MKNFYFLKTLFTIVIPLLLVSCDHEKNIQTKKDGMIFIQGGKFLMGGDNDEARSDEFPKHKVEVSSFWMDQNEVTNAFVTSF